MTSIKRTWRTIVSSYLHVCGDWRIINYSPCTVSDRLAKHIYPVELRIPTYLSSRSLVEAKIEDRRGPAQNQVPASRFLSCRTLNQPFFPLPPVQGLGAVALKWTLPA